MIRLFRMMVPLVVIMGCQSSPPPLRSLEVPYPEWHWGEYLQRVSSTEVITVVRAGKSPGLVRFDFNQPDQLQVLDPEAFDAKDIFYHQGFVVYRRGSDVYQRAPTGTISKLFSKIHRISGFCIDNESKPIISIEGDPSTTTLIRGTLQTTIPGNLRDLMCLDSKVHVVIQTDTALDARVLSAEFALIQSKILEAPSRTSYARWMRTGGDWSILALHAQTGILKEFSFSKDHPPRVVDSSGYTGQDIDVFEDQGETLVAYLDAWNLRPVLARRRGDAWERLTVPADGATGFYPRILRKEGSTISLSFHSFRTRDESKNTSFEDLVRVVLIWP